MGIELQMTPPPLSRSIADREPGVMGSWPLCAEAVAQTKAFGPAYP